ncbi:glycoside hydrolase family 28 protein [Pedobacter sp. SYSU D00535]|uniref:glycoside hydrolase family 28 protein n=1 Tax=Pedobacter sp. SYSU D00535 TaxID=2810308 RepID=UPI001A972E60|nr:glycoside hydrolase family 28 protein [Pedobacter sp. SYSU D00535]
MKDTNNTRRLFLKTSALAGAGVLASRLGFAESYPTEKSTISPAPDTQKPKLVLNVRDFGAAGDGQTKDTLAIQQAIDRCGVLGGGEVLFPKGTYLTGAIQLRSNTTLRLEKDAEILGTPDFADYPVSQVRWEGKWIKGHVSLIYAFDADHIGIVGPGKITGNRALGGRPNAQNPLRHPALIEPINCNHIRMEDFSTSYYLMWSIHPTLCNHISIKNLYIRSTGGNGDGIDIDSCKHVRIDGCDIETGDDCISLKSGRGMEGYSLLRTTEDVHISNCTFADTIFACIGIGSETSGGIRNLLIENCKFTKAKTHAIYIKSRPGRGAFIENIVCRNLEVSGMEGGFLRFNILGSGLQDQVPVPGHEGIPTIKDFHFSNVRVTDVPVLVDGTSIHPDKPLEGFSLKNISGTCRKGISLANIRKAEIRDITVTGYSGPLLSVYNVSGKGIKEAAALEPTKVLPPIPAPAASYQLK